MVANEDNVSSQVAGLRILKSEVVRFLGTIDVFYQIFLNPDRSYGTKKAISKGENKDVGEAKFNKMKAHWTMSN